MKFLPIAINIKNKKILLVGGGKVALEKIGFLMPFTSNLTVLAKDILPEVKATGVRCIQAAYGARCLKSFSIVYACTNNKTLNLRIRRDAHTQGLLVNVVDNPTFCDFISPAIYKQRHMTIAVNSDGRDVKRSIAWRDKIKEAFGKFESFL